MEAKDIIVKIEKAVKLEDILNITNITEEYKNIMKKIHPDICKLPGASDAAKKLNGFKDEFEVGKTYEDESGIFKSNGYTATYSGDITLLKKSLENFNKLKSFKDTAAKNFHKYMPASMELKGDKLEVKFNYRAIPLSGLTLPQVHVNWAWSRMLEFFAWVSQCGYVHCGINPETIFIVPENHGIQVASYSLMTKIDSKVTGISGKYSTWYPPQLFANKIATPEVDLELCMKTAIYTMGDKTGVGNKLRVDKKVNQELLNFAIKQHENPGETWKKYRELIDKNFKKEFHILNM